MKVLDKREEKDINERQSRDGRWKKQRQPLFGLEIPRMFLGQRPRLCSLPVLCGFTGEWDKNRAVRQYKNIIISWHNISALQLAVVSIIWKGAIISSAGPGSDFWHSVQLRLGLWATYRKERYLESSTQGCSSACLCQPVKHFRRLLDMSGACDA